MTFESKGPFAETANRQGVTLMSKAQHSSIKQLTSAGSAALLLVCLSAVAAGQGNSPTQLRQFIGEQAGGIGKLMVPSNDADLPQPRLPNGSPDPFFRTTEAKRFLGKMLGPDGKDSAGVRWRPGHQTNRLLRKLSPRRGGIEGRHVVQLRRGRRRAWVHGRLGELRRSPAAPARHSSAPAAVPAIPR
jgi:hypothetical protein